VLAAGGIALLVVKPFDGESSSHPSRPPAPPPTAEEKKAAAIERRLTDAPGDEKLLQAATMAWIGGGNERLSKARFGRLPSGHVTIPAVINRDYRAGLRAWNRYLRATGGEAGVNLAETAGETYFVLMEIGSRDLGELEADAAGAARALRIAGRQRPDMFTLSNVAIFEYYNDEFAAGDKAARGAAADVPPATAKEVIVELREYRELGQTFRWLLRRGARELRETGASLLKEPLKAYRTAAYLNQEEPPPLPRKSAATS
jgi:hypothetical protein